MLYLIKWTKITNQSIEAGDLQDAKIKIRWLEKLRKEDCKDGESIRAELAGVIR